MTDYKKLFVWEEYLKDQKASAVPRDAFSTRNAIKFKPGMVLEVVDKANPELIRPARIRMVDEYKIKLVFLEWDEKYAFWMDDDSSDLHQINWAGKTGHPLESPNGTLRCECSLSVCTLTNPINCIFFQHWHRLQRSRIAVHRTAKAPAIIDFPRNLRTQAPMNVRTKVKIGQPNVACHCQIDWDQML